MKHTEEWRKKQSEGVKKAWADGKYVGKPRPNYEAIAAKARGKKRPPHIAVFMREKMRGNKLGEKLRGRKLSPERREASLDYMARARAAAASPVAREKKSKSLSIAKLGVPGVGRAAANEDNALAKFWVVRSPSGVCYEFTNAAHWCRENEWLFSDDRPESKTPLWKRAFGGFSEMNGKRGQLCSWKGWTLVSVTEANNDSRDLLERVELKL